MHRDLKLENVLFDKSGNVKLCDFGFTREYEGRSSYLQTWCGTVCYSAPEMIKGEKYAGEKVDVWSLGVILYALLTGELPFDDDDETVTKQKIIKEEPKYPDSMPPPAKELINLLLSKRPLLRPSLADILTNPWLVEHAPAQQAILKLQQPATFSTSLEKDVLQRMRSAGVDIDIVIENVLAQRCDPLAGWWRLLLEKEDRKARRRERKRREADDKAMRRISSVSARLEPMAPTIMESVEEGHSNVNLAGGVERGREKRRSSGFPPLASDLMDSPTSKASEPLQPPVRISRRASSSRRRSQLGAPREGRRRNSELRIVTSNTTMLQPEASAQKKRRRYNTPFFNQLSNLKHWFKESTKRGRSPNAPVDNDLLSPSAAAAPGPNKLRRNHPPTSSKEAADPPSERTGKAATSRPRVSTASGSSNRRLSHSPSPLTPSSSYRRASGLRGRKSTSSSVSSVRSLHLHHHHHPSHSKASSTSSTSIISPPPSAQPLAAITHPRRPSPNTSRVPPALALAPEPRFSDAGSPFLGAGPASPGLVFARRRRSPFKGPMLGPGLASARRGSRGSRLVIEEDEREDDDDDDAFEEVDEAASPLEDPLAAGVRERLGGLAAEQQAHAGRDDDDEGAALKATSLLSDIREDADAASFQSAGGEAGAGR